MARTMTWASEVSLMVDGTAISRHTLGEEPTSVIRSTYFTAFRGGYLYSTDSISAHPTYLSHIQRERQLFYKGIKVLSLFFIDEVAKYRQYDDVGNPTNGIYADMFEEEYENIVHNMQIQFGEEEYLKYLNSISAHDTHAGSIILRGVPLIVLNKLHHLIISYNPLLVLRHTSINYPQEKETLAMHQSLLP